MDNEEVSGVKFSEFPAEAPDSSDEIVGLHSGNNARFSISNLIFATRQGLASLFVPLTRRINGKALSSDISLTASDVGARANDWMPTAAQVGARPDTWTPSAQDVGAVPVASVGVAGGVPNLDEIGRVPQNQLPPYPTVPAASTSNPQMDGAASPGSTGEWADGGHVHPSDTSRVPTTRTINGYDLTADRNLTAADVGALAEDGTAVGSYTLFPTKVYPGSLAAGWYKFAEVNITATTGRAKITFKYGLANASYDFIGDIFAYKTNSTTMNCTMQIPYISSGITAYFRYNVDSATTVSLYVYKHDSSGPPVFTFITSEDINGNYLDPSTYMLETLVAETPPATAIKPAYSATNRWIYNVPVSPGTNQQILSYSHSRITSASVLAKIEFANPEYIKSDCSWETTDGANPNNNGTITLTGTCTTATTANLLILNVV